MANETVLFEITFNAKDWCIDFNIPAKNDDYYRDHKQEIINKLRMLAERLENNQYPFHIDK